MLAGPPASYKSFLALDWVLSIVTQKKWHNRTCAPGKVLYMLGEGKSSLLKRIEAWAFYHQITAEERARIVENFRVTFDVPQMASKASVDNMLAGLVAEKFEPQVVVVDTFARSFVGMDENSQRDTGLWIESADRLRQAGFTVIFLHHTAKNTEFGLKYRGSTAIMGAMDTAYTIQKDYQCANLSNLVCTKQKDHDEGDPLTLQRLVVTPKNGEGSIVLVPGVRMDERFTAEYTKNEGIIDELIKDSTYESDRARARKLAEVSNITESAAQTKVSRRKKELDGKILQNRESTQVLQGVVCEA